VQRVRIALAGAALFAMMTGAVAAAGSCGWPVVRLVQECQHLLCFG